MANGFAPHPTKRSGHKKTKQMALLIYLCDATVQNGSVVQQQQITANSFVFEL